MIITPNSRSDMKSSQLAFLKLNLGIGFDTCGLRTGVTLSIIGLCFDHIANRFFKLLGISGQSERWVRVIVPFPFDARQGWSILCIIEDVSGVA